MAFNRTPVKVYAEDRKTVLGEVSPQTTSIGAAKLAGTKLAVQSRIDGRYAWVAHNVHPNFRGN